MTQIASLDRAQARAIPDLTALYREADRLELTPGWIKREQPILWHEPSSPFQPAHWRYSDVKKARTLILKLNPRDRRAALAMIES